MVGNEARYPRVIVSPFPVVAERIEQSEQADADGGARARLPGDHLSIGAPFHHITSPVAADLIGPSC